MDLKSKFMFFRKNNFVYLDSSATTQVPDVVLMSVRDSLAFRGNPNRSAHEISLKNEERIMLAKNNIARFVNSGADELVFTANTTDAVNLAVDSITHVIKKGDEIVLSVAEHHSNLLPFDKLVKKGAILKFVNLKEGVVDLDDFKKVLSDKTKIVSIQHCSNVLGSINSVEKIGDLIKKANKDIIFMVDGAQATAHIPVDVKKIKCDFYSFSGHKMYGPDGVGVLFVSKKVWPQLEMIRMGGGTISDASIVRGKKQDTLVIDKFQSLIGLEGGTPNVANIIGLSEAVSFIRSIGFEEIKNHEQSLLKILIDKLSRFEELEIVGPKNTKNKIGVLSVKIKDYSLKEVSDHLNKRKILVRYGSHCAFPLSNELGGETLRISLGCYNDEDDVERVIQELKFFFDKKKGLIKNKNLEKFRDFIYYKNVLEVNSVKNINRMIFSAISEDKNASVIIMAGHFLAIPDKKSNSFYPSIKPRLPNHLHYLLDEFGMTTFPIFTWEVGCDIVKNLKFQNVDAKLLVIANDTTGINELKDSPSNKTNKSAKEYREEFLIRFGNKTLPNEYLEVLKNKGLAVKDVLTFEDGQYYIRESLLRGQFKDFITKNKEFFDGMINYTMFENENLDIDIKILDNQQIKTCTFNTFNSKTGGKFCIAELTQLCAELFGKAKSVEYKGVSEPIKNHKINNKENIFVMLSPEMCDNAVSRAAELYNKVFLQERFDRKFKFFTVPFGPDSEKSLAIGSQVTYISDKDNLVELEVDDYPSFSELWKLNSYFLLYDINEHMNDIENIFKKINITKKSKVLDSCVGPGFMTVELLEKGYNVATVDKNKENVKPFLKSLETKGLKNKHTTCTWLELPKNFKNNSLDLIFNKGNTFIYAAGGFQEIIPIDKHESLKKYKETLKIYYDLLKKGGHLYIDKYKDSEIPAEKIAARLKILKTKEKQDIIFNVERKPKDGYRYASISLRDKHGVDKGHKFITYDLTEDELESLLKEVGFSVQKINLKSEKHFVTWLAQK